MKKFILARVNEEKNYINFLKIVFPTKRDAEMYLKGVQCVFEHGNWEIVELEEL